MTGEDKKPSWKTRFVLLFRRRSLDPPSMKKKHEGRFQGRHRRDGRGEASNDAKE